MRGYGGYRGKTRGRTFLKIAIVVLAAVLVLAAAVLFRLEPYLVYTDGGIRLDLPGHGPAETAPPAPEVSVPVVVVTPAPTPTPEPEPETFLALSLPRSALTDGTAAGLLEEAGANAAIFDMKADDGSLGYVSGLDRAREAGASAADPGLNEAIRALTGGGLHTVARVSCFRDNTIPYHDNATALRTAIGNWRDGENVRWLSPARESARTYVAEVCRELAALGFDEILLDNCAFPTEADGSLDSLAAGEAYPSDGTAAVDAFYSAVRAALADYPATMLSIVSTGAVLDGGGELSGQTAAQLAEYADRVWIPAPPGSLSDYERALTAAGMEDAASRLVLITDLLPSGEAGRWAALEDNS